MAVQSAMSPRVSVGELVYVAFLALVVVAWVMVPMALVLAGR